MKSLTIAEPRPSGLIIHSNVVERAKEYAEASKSCNTRKAYTNDWKQFRIWCEANEITTLPAQPNAVAMYITILTDTHKISSISRKLAAIGEAHRTAGFVSPTEDKDVQMIWKGIRRSKGIAKTEKKPILSDDLRIALENLPHNLHSVRDRALLLLGFVGAFRRSELVALNRTDLAFTKEGIVVHLKRSKTNQEGAGEEKAIPYSSTPSLCSVRALLAWIEATPDITEPLFVSIGKGEKVHPDRLSDKAVALIVKQRLGSLGKEIGDYSGHSLRAGFVTQAALNGASDRQIMAQTKHRSRAMIDRYVRVATVWQDNAATSLGL